MALTFELISARPSESREVFKERIFALLRKQAMDPRIEELKVTITEEKPPRWNVIPFGKKIIAAVRTQWSSKPADHDAERKEEAMASFVVHEDLPVSYKRYWPLEQASPGVCLLTLFRRKKDIPYNAFIDKWHNEHTPLSLKVHPLVHYSRNVVREKWGSHPYWYDGIVEEHCSSRKDLMDPSRFFGGFWKMLPNMLKVYKHVNSFLDYSSVETYLVKEYYFK